MAKLKIVLLILDNNLFNLKSIVLVMLSIIREY